MPVQQPLVGSLSYHVNLRQSYLQIFIYDSAVGGTDNGGIGHIVFFHDAVIKPWIASTGSRGVLGTQRALLIVKLSIGYGSVMKDWASTMTICDYKSLLQAVPKPVDLDHAVPDMQTSIAVLSAIMKLLVVWMPEHCNVSELVNQQEKLASASGLAMQHGIITMDCRLLPSSINR